MRYSNAAKPRVSGSILRVLLLALFPVAGAAGSAAAQDLRPTLAKLLRERIGADVAL